jgi:HK97 gp10 family phage protein
MADGTTVEVKGLTELKAALDSMSERLAVRGMRASLRKAGRVFTDAMRPLIHSTGGMQSKDEDVKERKHLADSLRTTTRVSKYGDCNARCGPARKLAYIANFLEFGTKPHVIRATHGKALLLSGGQLVMQVDHPGAAPKPFLRPAFDGNWEKALSTFKDSLAGFVEKNA